MIGVALAIWTVVAAVFFTYIAVSYRRALAEAKVHQARREAQAAISRELARQAIIDTDGDVLAVLEASTDWCDPHGIARP